MPATAPRLATHRPPENPLPFRMGLPALDAFPRKLWSRLSTRAARGLGTPELIYPHPAGDRPLREAIAAYLGVSRGIACTAEQVMVTAGFQGALALARSLLLHPGDAVWVEDPGYPLARQALGAAGVQISPVPVDREGLQVDVGIATAPNARLAVVTPTHQSPLGVALSLPRRLALLGWAAATGAWVLEDDYDSEFRYIGHPLPALKSLDRGGRVLYAGSFSKVLFPGLRLGYLVVPDQLAAIAMMAARLAKVALQPTTGIRPRSPRRISLFLLTASATLGLPPAGPTVCSLRSILPTVWPRVCSREESSARETAMAMTASAAPAA